MPGDQHVQRLIAAAKERALSVRRRDHLNPQINVSLTKQVQLLAVSHGNQEFGYSDFAASTDKIERTLRSVGDTASLSLLDHMSAENYRDGHGVETNDKRAYQLFKNASDVGLDVSKYNLALLTTYGRGCPPDPMAALRMFHEVVDNPLPLTSKNSVVQDILNAVSQPVPGKAMYCIGLNYINGVAVTRDLSKSVAWFEKAAAAGNPAGHDALGLAYWHGDGVVQDMAKSQQHLETAVKFGDINALINLARFHLSGAVSGIPDVARARLLLTEAKKQGHLKADELLARLPDSGSPSTPLLSRSPSSSRITHPYRAERIRTVRKGEVERHNNLALTPNAQTISKTSGFNKPKTQRHYSAESCQLIKLSEMEVNTDRFYEGHVLKARIVEQALPPILDGSLFCGIEDEDGSYECLSIMKWYERFPSAKAAAKAFCVGRQLAIVNPYHRIAQDGFVMIRVDDANSVIMNASEELGSVCYCCTKPLDAASVKKCSLCNTAIYCSKDCQTIDWKQNEHKATCRIFSFHRPSL
jgi:hypothetical protein